MLTASDIRGVCAFVPTPLCDDASLGDGGSSVDLDAATDGIERLIRDGVTMLALGGTTGEGAALVWEEKRELVAAVVSQSAGRVPVFAGAIALGTREVVQQMRALRDLGAAGAIVTPPFWQTPTVDNAVGFVEDVSEAVPDLPTMVYSNKFLFKFDYPTEFWSRIASGRSTAIATKVSYDFRPEDYAAAGSHIKFMGGEGNYGAVHAVLGKEAHAVWATSAAMGPAPWVALVQAAGSGDATAVERIWGEIMSVPPPMPMEEFQLFSSYNIQLEKVRIETAGYMRCGGQRAPYVDIPPAWREAAERNGRAWAELASRYS